MYKKILCLSCLVVLGVLTTAKVSYAVHEGAEHDEGGFFVEEPLTPSVQTPNVSVTQFNPDTGIISGGVIDAPVELGSVSGSGSGSGFGSGLGSSSGTTSGSGTPTIGDSDTGSSNGTGSGDGLGSQEISLNDAAKLLSDNINTLAAVEEEIRISSNTRRNVLDETRHIVRNKNSCPVPNRLNAEADKAIEAREVLERQIAQSQKFIEQVNSIDHDKNLW